jgi:hypothetical protein
MPLTLSLSPEEEAQFEAWAAQQGEAVQQDARAVSSALAERGPRQALASHFFQAVTLTQPVIDEAVRHGLGIGEYLLVLLKTITALYHAHGGRRATSAERSPRAPLEDALTLYELGVVSVSTAAQIARVPVREFRFAAANSRRIDLIRKRTREGLTEAEEAELQQLHGEIRRQVDARHPLPQPLRGPHPSAGRQPDTHPAQTAPCPDPAGGCDPA